MIETTSSIKSNFKAVRKSKTFTRGQPPKKQLPKLSQAMQGPRRKKSDSLPSLPLAMLADRVDMFEIVRPSKVRRSGPSFSEATVSFFVSNQPVADVEVLRTYRELHGQQATMYTCTAAQSRKTAASRSRKAVDSVIRSYLKFLNSFRT